MAPGTRQAALPGLDEAAVRRVAETVGGMLPQRCVIHLQGPMGAGKTVFASALLRAAGVEGTCPSPTFSLAETYEAGGRRIGHMDFFRCVDRGEWVGAGMAEQMGDLDLCLVEWPSNAGDLPVPDLLVEMAMGAREDLRDLSVVAHSDWGAKCCERLS